MSEKFYKLVDGILWADWDEPKSENFELSSDWMFAWKKYESRPHYPLSGTLEGKDKYEENVDFEIINQHNHPLYAIPIAQPVVTIGQILKRQIQLHELNPDTVEKEIGLPKGTLTKLMDNDYYTNSVPVVLFKNLILSLHIPFAEIEAAMIPTFKVLLSKETPESIKKKPHGYMLWENEESVLKYTNRLKELSAQPVEGEKEDEVWENFMVEYESLRRMEENDWEFNRNILKEKYHITKK